MTYNIDHAVYTAIVQGQDGPDIFSALKWDDLVTKLAKAGVYEASVATESNPVESYCIEITADINLDLFKSRPKVGFALKADGACMHGQDRAAWKYGTGRHA